MSGTTCTWAHHAVEKDIEITIQALWLTVGLGVAFTLLQAFEYYEAFHHYLSLRMEFILLFLHGNRFPWFSCHGRHSIFSSLLI